MTWSRPLGMPSRILILHICVLVMCGLSLVAPAFLKDDEILKSGIWVFAVLCVLGAASNVGKNVGKDETFLCKETWKGAHTRRQAIPDLMMADPNISASQSAMILNDSARTVERNLDWLSASGEFDREGDWAERIRIVSGVAE